jgi:hypothetical protein
MQQRIPHSYIQNIDGAENGKHPTESDPPILNAKLQERGAGEHRSIGSGRENRRTSGRVIYRNNNRDVPQDALSDRKTVLYQYCGGGENVPD